MPRRAVAPIWGSPALAKSSHPGSSGPGPTPSPAGAALTTGSAAYTHQLTVTGNNGAVTYAKTGGNAHLTVGSGGKVTTTGPLAAGVYAASGRTTDVYGDHGTFSF